MKCKCPACGASLSLDVIIQHQGASDALFAAMSISGEIGREMVSYLSLFRPPKSSLTMSRVAKLIDELLPDLQAGKIQRGGVLYDAPVEAWIYAMQATVAQRNSLKLPLKSHGYLYEIISTYKPTGTVITATANSNKVNHSSKTMGAIQNLARFANGE